MSEWHDELELALLLLEDARIDSDCMTFVISSILSKHHIFHQCRIGYVEDRATRMLTSAHCWIELEQGWCIDLRLRQWLGDEDEIPHGVFRFSDYPRVKYQGLPLQVATLDETQLETLTDCSHYKIQIPLGREITT